MEKERPSKSQKKREAEKLQKLGEALVALPEVEIHKMEIPEKLKDAVFAAQGQGMNKHGAKRRQLQFIGSIMRTLDPEPIEAALENISRGRANAQHQFKTMEKWRDEMILETLTVSANQNVEETDTNDAIGAMERFLEMYPKTDRQRLSQLIRNASKESSLTLNPSNPPPKKGAPKMHKSQRTLFRYIREMVENG